MPLGVVMDERICTGFEYAAFCNSFRRYLAHPELLEANFDGSVDPEAVIEAPVAEEKSAEEATV